MAPDETTDRPDDAFRLMYVGRSSFQIERGAGDRLERLIHEGFEVHVLAADDGGFEALSRRGVNGVAIPVGEGPTRIPALIAAFFIVQGHFIDQPPVLVHARDDVMAWIGAVAASRIGVPAIFASHVTARRGGDRVDFGGMRARLWAPELVASLEDALGSGLGVGLHTGWSALVGHLGSLCDVFVADDEADAEYLEDREMVAPGKLEVIVGGDGVDLERFNPEDDDFPDVSEARRTYEVPVRWDRVVGYRGPLVADRAGADLLAAIDLMLERRSGIGWLVDLTEPVDEGMLRRLERRTESGHIQLAANASVPEYYRCLDLLAVPGRDRGAARMALEASAMKVPVVAFADSPAGSIVSDGHTGRLVQAGRRQEFPAVVAGLVGDPKRLGEFGIRARTRASQRFDRRDIDARMLRLYDRVLSEKLESGG